MNISEEPNVFFMLPSAGLNCMHRKINEYNMYLNDVCARNYYIKHKEFKSKIKYGQLKITFELELIQSNPYSFMSEVLCEIICTPINDPNLTDSGALNLITNQNEPNYIGALIIGALDSDTDEEHQGKGYNKFMRTCAYSIMRACFNAHVIATNAVSIETFHVLTDYFAFATPVHVRNIMIDRAINQLMRTQPIDMSEEKRTYLIRRLTEQKVQNIQENARAIQLLEQLKYVGFYSYNMICDLTDSAKLDILKQMETFVFKCECPPCSVALAAAR